MGPLDFSLVRLLDNIPLLGGGGDKALPVSPADSNIHYMAIIWTMCIVVTRCRVQSS